MPKLDSTRASRSESVVPEQRFSARNPCPICGGHEQAPRGKSERCHGYFSGDERYAHCAREERAGSLSPHPTTGLYVHRLDVSCKCGLPHADRSTESTSKADTARRRVVEIYDYIDERGELLYQVCRTIPKGFFQRRPDGRGGWINKLGNVRRILYLLPELLAFEGEAFVFVGEGEKDANAVAALGCTATTNATGAKHWRREYNEAFKHRNVVLLQDKDSDGETRCRKVTRELRGVAATVRILLLPSLPEKGDVSDWIDAQKATGLNDAAIRDELLRLADGAGVLSATNGSAANNDTGTETADQPATGWDITPDTRTDLANAERFVHQHGKDLHYIHVHQHWRVWDGARYTLDTGGMVDQLAIKTIRSILREAADAPDKTSAHELAKWAKYSESQRGLAGLLRFARSLEPIPARPDVFDTHPLLLNVGNCVIDLKTGEPKPHDPTLLMSRIAPVLFDPQATAPTWDQFLNRIFGEDEELIAFIQRSIGYSLTGDTSEQVFWMMHGTGANGKSTLLETVSALLGDYALKTRAETLLAKRSDAIPNDVAALDGPRFVYAVEPMEGRHLATSLVKELVGGDTISARFMRGEFFTFRPKLKLWLWANHKPTIRDTTIAMWRRLLLVPFNITIPPKDQDKRLPEKLRSELPGILNWALVGCREWLRIGLQPPKTVREATAQYREEEDPVAAFISDCCVVEPQACVMAGELYAQHYVPWCERTREYVLTQNACGRRLAEKGFQKERTGKGRMRWIGVGLRVED